MEKIIEIIKKELEELKNKENWQEYNLLKKQLRKIYENENKENIALEKEEKYRNIKNITFVKRDVLKRRQKGYFSEVEEVVTFKNKTDKQIDKEFMKKLGEPLDNERLRKENKMLRQKIKVLKEMIKEGN